MKYTNAERETTLTWDDELKTVTLYTSSPVTMRKLDKFVCEHPDAYQCTWTEDGGTAKKYSFPAKYVRFGRPASAARIAAGKRLASASKNTT